MKAPIRILFVATLATQFTSCGRDKATANLEKQLRSSENCVTNLLQQTIANNDGLDGVEFSADFDKTMYLQSIKNLEAEVGEFNKLDMVMAKWNPEDYPEQSAGGGDREKAPHMEANNFRVTAVALSGEQSGATLNIYLKPQGSSWTVIGMNAESASTSTDAPTPVSQATD